MPIPLFSKRSLHRKLARTLPTAFVFVGVTTVCLVIWATDLHATICTNSIQISAEEALLNKRDSGINATRTGLNYMFRSNIPLTDTTIIGKSSYFKARTQVVSPLMVNYTFEPKNLCNGVEGAPYLLVMIPSVCYHTKLRQTIRRTWGSVVSAPWPRTRNLPKVKIMFIFGRGSLEEEESILRSEAEVHGDVLYVDFVDSYRNLSYKSLTGLYWASTRCAQAKFLMKVDEDTFVNVPYLLEYLLYHEKDFKRTLVGFAISKPVTVRFGRWGVSVDAYPLSVFPRYLYGHSYVITTDVIEELVNMSLYLPFIPVEDALITGVLAYAVGAIRLHNPLFAVVTPPYTCEVVRNTKISLTQISQRSHNRIWKAVQDGECNYTALNKD